MSLASTPHADGRGPRPSVAGLIRYQAPEYAAPLALVLVGVVFSIATPNFLTGGNITALLVTSAILAVISLGQQLAIVVAGIDLSVGASVPFAAVMLGWATIHGLPVFVGCLMAVGGGLACGLINGFLIGYLKMTDFVVTLGTLSLFSGVTLLITQGNTLSVSSNWLQGLALNGVGPVRWFWLIGLLLAVATWFLVFRTRLGTHLLAVGGNADGARGTGISPARIRLIAYLISGLMCGLAGIMVVAQEGGSDPTLQTTYLLSSIAAVVMGGSALSGGRASIPGTITGAVLLTALVNGFAILGISQYYQPVAVGVVVLIAARIAGFRRAR